jgi:hypothetical protein
MKQGSTLEQLAAELDRRQASKVDYLAPTDKITLFPHQGQYEMELAGTDADALGVNDLAHAQIAAKLNIPKRYYDRLRVEVPGLMTENVNRLLRHHPGKAADNWMIRVLDDTARACLSDSYRTIDDYDIAQTVLPILGDIPDVRIESCALTETRMYIKAVTPAVTAEVKLGDEVCAGVVIRNSEVGVGSFSVEPMVFRLVCLNGMISGSAGAGMMRQVHLGRRVQSDNLGHILRAETRAADDKAFMMAIGDVVRAAVDEVRFRDVVAQMQRAAEDAPIQNVHSAVEILTKREGLSDGEGHGILQHLAAGGDLTRWGLLNAVTRQAQDVDSYDRATELEALGGKVLAYAPREWSDLARAAS